MVRFTLSPLRFYVFGRRVHHGALGVLLILADWHDRGVWLTDFLRHPESARTVK